MMEVYPTRELTGGGRGGSTLLVYALKTLSCNAKNTDRHVDGGWDRAGHGRAGQGRMCGGLFKVQ